MRIVSLSALTLLSGCSIFVPQWEGVWLLEFPVKSDGTQTAADYCDSECDENFQDADCPDVEEIDSEWDYTEERELSPEAYFIEIFNGKGGEVFGVVGTEVYVGTDTVKALTLEWKGFTDSHDVDEHEDGYTYEVNELSDVLDKITLTKEKGGVVSGTWSTTSKSEIEYIESDEWDPADMDGIVPSGQIPSQNLLIPDDQGDNRNSAEDEECSGGECELLIASDCKPDARKFNASYAGKYENGMYTGISPASQPAGAGGGNP
jgi:hypothetical protein